uniref:Uncharacterized protein n=1 Tax=Picea sitchensis TaxID=3332 RepID=D5AA43_PICSI|nr:unknown [Picea sitchensis]
MHITLHKRETGQTWPLPRYGQGELDPLSVDQEQRRFMLQRFQEEFPGDFGHIHYYLNMRRSRNEQAFWFVVAVSW